MRLGLYGGRFDPIHLGHLLVAEAAREALALDEIQFIPSREPPHKAVAAPAEHRHAMTLLAVTSHPAFHVSTAELRREGPSYTVDTVEGVRRARPQDELFYLVGTDAYAEIHTWHRPRDLLEQVRMVVLPRPGYTLATLAAEWLEQATLLKTPLWEISSTDVRARLAAGKSVRYLLPGAVAAYIAKEGLYRS
jgi:nicotinate-nucleotide adenylyltransferase